MRDMWVTRMWSHRRGRAVAWVPGVLLASVTLVGADPAAGASTTLSCFGLPPTRVMASPGTVWGTSGQDVIVGSPGDDTIVALDGNDAVCGRGGDDEIIGHLGDDVLLGGPGNDTITGADGSDTSLGQDGDDTLYDVYPDGTNWLKGGPGNDRLDVLEGSPGDTVNGDSGSNVCTYDRGDIVLNCGSSSPTTTTTLVCPNPPRCHEN